VIGVQGRAECALRSGQHVEVVDLVLRGGRDDVIAAWYQHKVPVAGDGRLVQGPVRGVDALEGEPLCRPDAEIVTLLKFR
jgi:hypothetical protein